MITRSLAGQVALVTGGARRVGRAIGLCLAEAGMDVAITCHTRTKDAAKTVGQIRKMGRQAHAIRMDLRQPEVADRLHEAFTEHFDRLDVLVNNASCFTAGRLGQITAQSFHDHMAVNACAPLLLIQKFAPLLATGHELDPDNPWSGGRVVNLVDTHVVSGMPLTAYAAYSASKAALAQITRVCALQLAPKVTVNAIAPGVVAWHETSSDRLRKAYVARVPLGRIGTPQDVAGAALFLIRDAPYCTGQIIQIDGGRSLT